VTVASKAQGAAASRGLARAVSVEDVRRLAKRRLPRAVMDFIEGGAEDELTIRRNRAAFGSVGWIPSALTDVSARDQNTTVLGTPVRSPIVLSPVGLAALANPSAGEVAAARAASKMGIISTLSSSSGRSLEEVGASCAGPKWFQLYVWRDRKLTQEVVERARAAGYGALCLTVDVQVSARRERDLHNGFVVPPKPRLSQAGDLISHAAWFRELLGATVAGHGITMGSFTLKDVGIRGRLRMIDVVNDLFDPSMNWRDLEWLKEIWGGPLVIKGIMNPADARRCVDSGADAVWVSNHGGRQLDGLSASVTVLPAVVEAVAGDAEVYIDGGIRRGSDIVKCLALGAKACMIGRPYVYGLAAGGTAGVEKVIQILMAEIDATMALLGRPSLKDLDASCVTTLR
jgi:isopentenyl diphosphate isomerase/L-lactate dehydrogenase-like FMN-dependent dehydrogenase